MQVVISEAWPRPTGNLTAYVGGRIEPPPFHTGAFKIRESPTVPYHPHVLRYAVAAISVAAIVCCCGFLLRDASTRNTPASAAESTTTTVLSAPDGPVPAAIHTTVRRGS